MLLLTAVLLFNSDPLEGVINVEYAERHAKDENATLVKEKEKMERERGMMARERELWEKAKEARVPRGAFWDVVWPAWDCRAYGKREYWGSLRNVPEGWDAIDACMNMPVEIKGVKIRRPDRCAHVSVFPEVQVHGFWMVDWDQSDCKPWWSDFEDKVGRNFANRPSIRPYVSSDRDARAITPGSVESKLRSWASTIREVKIGGCCVTAHLWFGT